MKYKTVYVQGLLCVSLVVGFTAPAFAGFSFTPKQESSVVSVQDDTVPPATKEETVVPSVTQTEMPSQDTVNTQPPPPVAVVKQQALPVATPRLDKEFKGKVVEGFGSGIPLVIAIRQIVPPKYGFVFGDGLDLGMKVDWQGGLPWNEVLDNLRSNYHFAVRISNDIVKIEPAGDAPDTLNLSSDEKEVPAPAAPPITLVPPTVIEETPVIEPMKPIKTMAEDEKAISDDAVNSAPEKTNKQTKESVVWDEASNPSVPVISADGTITEPEEETTVLKSDEADMLAPQAMPEPITKKKILVLEDYKASPVEPAQDNTSKDAKDEEIVANGEGEAPEFMDSIQKATQNVDTQAIQPFPVGQTESVWTAEMGDTLRGAIQKWADAEGISLVWNSEYDYPIQANVTVVGTFESAVRNLLDGFTMANPKPTAKLYTNKPSGMPVLVVETIQISK